MTLPDRIAEDVGAVIGARIVAATPIAGGCIHNGTRIETDAGDAFFLKWNDSAVPGVYDAEMDGLRALRAVEGVRAPEPLAASDRWLLLEWVPAERPSEDTPVRLGRMLAALHRAPVAAAIGATTFGWPRDNWIGSLPQANEERARWSDFWRDRRIVPQLEMARRNGYLRDDTLDRAVEVIPDALADVIEPELVHGDLWSGNWLVTTYGAPVLVDPAVYRGHGEVDLAMSELFGGFQRAFYDTYLAEHGISAEYVQYRRDLYQLYYLLVHVNLFGASYEAKSVSKARSVVNALR